MADFPALPLWTDSYMADTHPGLSLEEHGCYLMLLQAAWRRSTCDVPDDDRWFCKFLGIHGNKWRVLRVTVLERFWTFDPDGPSWHQKRLRKERDFVEKRARKQKENAEKRWAQHSKTKELPDAAAYAPTPTPTPTPIEEESKRSPSGLLLTESSASERAIVVTVAQFNRWWAECPRKVGKEAAGRKIKAVIKGGQVTMDELIDGMRRYASHVRANATEPQFVVHPATWLNQGRWQDDLSTDGRTENARRTGSHASPDKQLLTEWLLGMAENPGHRFAADVVGDQGNGDCKIVDLRRSARA